MNSPTWAPQRDGVSQYVLLVFGVHRRIVSSLYNLMLPIFCISLLAFMIYFIEIKEVYRRLELTFALFLALAGNYMVIIPLHECI